MRIISGTHKGRRIIAPKNLPVRPTTDFAKESLFNILNNHYYFNEISLLDLFTGTGNISYEFASRGCDNIIAVDSHYACVQFVNKISTDFNFNIQTIKADVFKFLESSKSRHTVIFADPPYEFETPQLETLVQSVFNHNLLEDDGILIIEHAKYTDLSTLDHFSYQKGYGGCVFSFFETHNE